MLEEFQNKMKKYVIILAVTAFILLVSLATVYFMYRGRLNEKKESAVAYTDLSSSDDDQAIDSDVDD